MTYDLKSLNINKTKTYDNLNSLLLWHVQQGGEDNPVLLWHVQQGVEDKPVLYDMFSRV
jgi:hypothetical protein